MQCLAFVMPRLRLRDLAASALALGGWTYAAAAADAPLAQVEKVLHQEAQARLPRQADVGASTPRIEVSVGELDSRVRLAPCARIEPYLPAGFKPWGRTRVGVRCTEGPTRWNVFLPVTVRVYAQAWVARTALPAGAVVSEADLVRAEVDLAASPDPVIEDAGRAVGRTLARAVAPGEPFRTTHMRPIQWFSAGETVKVVAVGKGFSVVGEARALGPGLDGQKVRVRTDSGRVVVGVASAAQTVEVRL